MDTEFFDDTETILTRTINELPAKEFFVVSDEANVSDVCLQVLIQGESVVENQDHFMLGVLDCQLAADLIQKEGALSQYVESLAPLALCPPETEVQTIKYAIQELGVVPWLVLLTEGTGVGLVPPETMFKTLAQHFHPDRWLEARTFWIEVGTSLINPKSPKPTTGPPICYCCSQIHNGHTPHRLVRSQITNRDRARKLVCPFHSNQPVNQSIGCTAC